MRGSAHLRFPGRRGRTAPGAERGKGSPAAARALQTPTPPRPRGATERKADVIYLLGTKVSGRLRVTCPGVFAEEHAPGINARFCRKHPEIQIDLAPD